MFDLNNFVLKSVLDCSVGELVCLFHKPRFNDLPDKFASVLVFKM